MKYLANLNNNHMLSFLLLSIGSLLAGTEDRSNITNHYYITDRAFTIRQGGIINVEYGVKQNDSYLSGALNPITVEFAGSGGPQDALDYNHLPILADMSERSVSAWINLDSMIAVGVICGMYSDDSGFIFYNSSSNNQLRLAVKYASNQMVWNTPNNSLSTGSWIHVAFTRPRTTYNVKPIMYINGAAVTVTDNGLTPSGLPNTEIGNRFLIGNAKTATVDYIWGVDGKVFDVRVKSGILTAAEVLEMYNAGVPDEALVTDGILFQGPAIQSDVGDATSLAGFTLGSTSRLPENALRAVGIPHGAPVIRANP